MYNINKFLHSSIQKLVLLMFCLLVVSNAFGVINDLKINEIQSINDSTIADEYGEYDDWVEITNIGIDDINLNGCYVTDDLGNITKWQISDTDFIIAPNEYKLLWLDGNILQGKNHLPYNISGMGEAFAIYSPAMQLIDFLVIPQGRPDISQGRKPDGTGAWMWFTDPTPGTSNSTKSYLGITPEPLFSAPGGLYQTGFSCEINPQLATDKIYYTTDSHDPDSLSLPYLIAVNIDHTSVLRAIAIREGYLPSNIVSQFYLFNKTYSLPIWATITDPDNLYGDYGIYTHPWDTGFAAERFAQHQYFINNHLEFSINSGIRIQGGNSVGMAKKSFRQFYKSRYGYNELDYPMFSHTQVSSFYKLVFRAGYDDDITTSVGTLLRDPLSSEVYRNIGEIISNSEFSILFLDSTFWGIYNIKESVDERFVQDHTGLDSFDLVRYQKYGVELKYGTLDEWNAMDQFVKTTNFAVDSNYYKVCEMIDMGSLLNLLAFVHATEYRSWTWGCFVFKGYNISDKWRWTIWDTDRSYENVTWNGFTDYASTINEKWANILPQKLLQSPIFKQQLINRTADFLNYYFVPDEIIGVLDSLVMLIEPDIQAEKERWNASAAWSSHVESVRNFLRSRPDIVRRQILSYFSLPDSVTVDLDVVGKGRIILNSLNLSEFPWSGIYFETVPVTVRAIPNPGYKFTSWNFTSSIDPEQLVELNSDISLIAYFEVDSTVTDTGIVVINEIMYNNGPDDMSDDWIELYNPSNTKDLSLWTIKDGNDTHEFIIPLGTFLMPGNYLVLAKDLYSFAVQYPSVTDVIGSFGSGSYGFGLGSNGDIVRLYDKYGTLVDSVAFDDNLPWPDAPDGNGPSLQLISAEYDNSVAQSWSASWIYPSTPGYKNFTGNTSVIQVNSNIKFNAILYPNPATDHVWLNLDLKESMHIKVELYDLLGRNMGLLFDGNLYQGNQLIELQLNDLNLVNAHKGMFILRIYNEKQSVALKLLLK